MCQDYYPNADDYANRREEADYVEDRANRELDRQAAEFSKEIANLNITIKSLRDLLAEQAKRADGLQAEVDVLTDKLIKAGNAKSDAKEDLDAALAREARLWEALEDAEATLDAIEIGRGGCNQHWCAETAMGQRARRAALSTPTAGGDHEPVE
jgi:uncharacterized coiled-coil protein SlyX